MSRPLLLVFASSFGATTSFYLLLSVVPVFATRIAGGVGAGFSTGALMGSTVAAELLTPRLMRRFGPRAMLACGLLLLGVPALALPVSTNMAAIVAVCLVRGLGFAIVMVVGGALAATLVPESRRGEGLALYGVVAGVSAVIALPLGLWLAGRIGYSPVFAAGAVAALAGLACVPGLPGREPESDGPVRVLAALRTPSLVRPSLIFSATAMAAGVVVTFLPLALTQASGALAAAALLTQAAATTLSRWWAGRYGDRHHPATLLIPSVLASATGMLALVFVSSPVAVVAGMIVFGAGFGVAQNASLALMCDRVSPSGFGTVSAVWSVAYDAGLGIGAAGFGIVAARTGYPAAFAVVAGLVLTALVPALRDRLRDVDEKPAMLAVLVDIPARDDGANRLEVWRNAQSEGDSLLGPERIPDRVRDGGHVQVREPV